MNVRRLAIRVLACGAAAFAAAPVPAAPADTAGSGPPPSGLFRGSSIAVRYDVSPPLGSIPPGPVKGPARRGPEELSTGLEGPLGPQSADPIVQTEAGTGAIPPPIATFDGPGNMANVSPPDPVGDVGPSHYVAMSNLYFAVYDKTGTLLYGPAANNTLWAGFGGPCQTENAGDPIVLYDQAADRWMLTQFTGAGPTWYNCVAVSTTGDPTGTYYRYAFSTGNNFPDYPKYGIWSDAYYISTREFANGATFAGIGAYALNRAQLIAGNPAAQVISFLIPPGGTPYNIGDGLLPADLDGSVPPPPASPGYFMGSMDNGGPYGAPQDALTLWKFDVDFATPVNSTLTMAAPIPVAAFDSIFPCAPSSRDCIPQPGTTTKVDILSYRQRLMHRLAYRNFGTHEALVANQSVEATPGIAGVRWYEIRDPNGTPTVFQQGTYAPGATDGIHRWMGSIAMDAAGDVALGYSASDGVSTFPSSWYTGRLAGDPPGTLPQGEGSIIHGTGSQTASARWGDYTSMNVDPVDDCTFWYVNQYVPVSSPIGWRLRIGSFKFPGCVAGPSGTLEGQVTVCGGGGPIAGASVSTGLYGTTTDAGGNYSFSMPPGDYTVTIAAVGYTSGGGPVTITDGGTTVLDACLTGVPIIVSAGATLTEEGCGPGNGAVDPGETVTMNFCVRNVGGASTTNLVGDLEEAGGIGDAPDPAVFGAVLAGGPDVCADVTFSASEELVCGDQVAPLLELEDGAADLGFAGFGPFLAGTPVYALLENLDGVAAPALPGGWTTATTGGPLPVWVTSTTTADTPPNALFSPDPNGAGAGWVNEIVTPSFPVTSPTAALRFRHNYDLEDTYDGGVLEISIGGGPFQDILAAGGVFVSGGYTDIIDAGFASPIAGRQAWSGNSGGFVTTEITLPAAAAGQNMQLKWRCGVDSSVAGSGWYVDSIAVQEGVACCTPIPEGLEVDAVEDAPSNGVWEPGETVVVEPAYFNGDSAVLSLSGTASNLTGPAGATYTLVDSIANYGSIAPNADASCLGTGDCYSVSVDDPVVRPAAHWDAAMDETLSTGSPKHWILHIGDSFGDVPDAHMFYAFIETIFHKGVTGGCGGTSYCPGNPALRKQMAVFLLKARYGAAYVPPAAVGIFADVPQGDTFAPWIEDLYNRGITGGCSVAPLSFCPDNTVLRQQMAVFLLKTLEGAAYEPPDCEGVFGDVPCPSTFADWIEELADREITGGCGGGNFCPASPNTRGQMAVFLTKTFGLVLYGP
jgi:Carboxypeptidase regulatory-like domain